MSMMFPLKQNCLRTTVYLQTGVCLSYSKKIAFMLTSDSYSCCTIFNATFLLCSQRTCLEGIFYKMFVIAYKKNVLCLALWLFLRSKLKWIYENVTCSTLLYSFNEKFFPIYVRQCLSELISYYVKEKSTWLILKELFDT